MMTDMYKKSRTRDLKSGFKKETPAEFAMRIMDEIFKEVCKNVESF